MYRLDVSEAEHTGCSDPKKANGNSIKKDGRGAYRKTGIA